MLGARQGRRGTLKGLQMKPVPGLPIEQQPAAILARMLLWGEARGESVLGAIAVLAVAYNRAAHSGKTLRDVILKPLQFSSFNAHDPNRAKLLDAWKDDPLGWNRADLVCELWEEKLLTDPTAGATHYYAFNVVQPKWGRGSPEWKETAIIDHQVFGNA